MLHVILTTSFKNSPGAFWFWLLYPWNFKCLVWETMLPIKLFPLGRYPHFYPGKKYHFLIILPAYLGLLLLLMDFWFISSHPHSCTLKFSFLITRMLAISLVLMLNEFLSFFYTPETPVPGSFLLPTGPITLACILFFLLRLQCQLLRDSHSLSSSGSDATTLADFCRALACLSPLHYSETIHQSASNSPSVLFRGDSLVEGDADYHTFTLLRSHTFHVRGLPRDSRKLTVQVGALLLPDVWVACPWTAVLVGAGD